MSSPSSEMRIPAAADGTASPLQPWTRWLVVGSASGVDAALLLLRGCFGLALAFAHGYAKLTHPGRFLNALAERGVPLPALFGWGAIASEFLGGLLLALGLLTRPAAVLVLVTLTVAALFAHANEPFAERELALAYAVVALAVLIAGPGRFSLDKRLLRGG